MVDAARHGADEGPPGEGRDGAIRIGPFRLLERLGVGGMGVVHLAERRDPIEQRVALKVIRTDRLDKTYRARFAMEQVALARMDHPNIARLLDAGDSDGESWFAMEYVPGTPLSDYCREHRLPIEARLRLFTQICAGVQHAHMKGILHRDLKPANILVREIDGRPVAKIIDFGLAQPVDPLQIRATLHESMRQVVGTIAYMSPEQAERTEGDLDTRTDVYSLGVILYEMLTGQVPIDVAELERRGLPWIGDFLREHEPKKPSTRLSSMGEQLSTTAAERCTSPGRLRASVRGDLDWVTMKALERDRQRRYATVRELGREAERVLRHEPVEAGPPSSWYVARKWVRRHAVGAAVAAAVLLAAGTVLVVARVMAERTRAAEARREMLIEARHVVHLVERGRHELWPATEAVVPLMDEWLAAVARARRFGDAWREVHGRLADELARSQRAGAPKDLLAASQLRSLDESLSALAELDKLEVRVSRRRDRALAKRRQTVEAHQDAWTATCVALHEDADYRGLDLVPVPGLVPLGRNPATGLFEFYLPESGAEGHSPRREPDGTFAVGAETGLIFVLIPAGSFVDPLGESAQPDARRELAPFLLSRYEMTQAQWARLIGEGLATARELRAHVFGNDPDGLQRRAGEVGEAAIGDDLLTWEAVFWDHPVQQVSWDDAAKFLPRWSLGLPTVAQMWWAANGRREQRLCFAWLPADCGLAVNFEDEARLAARVWRNVRPGAPSARWDGFFHTCPVDALAPNPYGLHSVFGNVAEWCLDAYKEPLTTRAAGPAQRMLAAPTGRAVTMGGSFLGPFDRAAFLGALYRGPARSPEDRESPLKVKQAPTCNVHDYLGVRPVFCFLSGDR